VHPGDIMIMGAQEYRRIQDLETQAHRLGFRVSFPEHSYSTNLLSLSPLTENDVEHLPIYWREASLMHGSVDELLASLRGWEKCMEYLRLLGVVTTRRIQRKEQDYRNAQLVQRLARAEEADSNQKK